MATFSELRQQQEVLLGAQHDKETAGVESTSAKRRHERASFITQGIAKWFAQRPMFESIEVTTAFDRDEISDHWFNGSITVYGPKREADFEASRGLEDFKYKIVPGYINASSWQAGSHDCTVLEVQQELQHRLRMMEMAIACLNQRNQVCLEWGEVANPMFKVREQERALNVYREREREQIKKEQDRKAKKSA